MTPIPVSVINASKLLKDAEIPPVITALQIQVSQHLAPKWHVDAVLDFSPARKDPPAGHWRLELRDDTDYPPDSGYHNVEAGGTPYGRVFVNTSRQYNENWTITASHELLEMLVNPYAVFAAYVPFGDNNTGGFYNLEICDPVSPDENGYQINGIQVSDFVFPEWFSPFLAEPRPGEFTQIDYCKRLTRPAPSMVAATMITAFGWQNIQSQAAAAVARLGRDAASLANRLA
jgi:hypothetical protein